jgi:hypothetical protein
LEHLTLSGWVVSIVDAPASGWRINMRSATTPFFDSHEPTGSTIV